MFAKLLIFAALLALAFTSGTSLAAGSVLLSGLNAPTGLAYDTAGRLYISCWGNGQIWRLDKNGISVVLENLPSPAGLAFDSEGNLLIAGYGDGNIYVWDGKARPRVLASGFAAPTGLLWNREGKLLVANRNAGEIVAVNGDGSKETVSKGHKTPVGIAQTPDGTLFISCYGGSVDILSPAGSKSSVFEGLGTPGAGIVSGPDNTAWTVDYARGEIVHIGKNGVLGNIASGLSAPVALAKKPGGDLIAGCWGDSSLHIIKMEEK